MSDKNKLPIPEIEVWAARDAMMAVWAAAERKGSTGVSWLYLAEVALEAALSVRGRGATLHQAMIERSETMQ